MTKYPGLKADVAMLKRALPALGTKACDFTRGNLDIQDELLN